MQSDLSTMGSIALSYFRNLFSLGLPNFDGLEISLTDVVSVDPTRSTDRRDSLLNGRKNAKRKCGLIFEFWKIRPQGGTVLLWSRHLLLFLFLNGENQVRTKKPQ